MRNPFTIGIVSDGDDFCNRRREIRDLRRHAENGANVVLFSPRRFGKSSLVTVVQSELSKKGMATVYVDLFPVTSKSDLLARLASAFFKGLGRGADPRSFLQKAKGLFGRLRPNISISAEGVTLSADLDPRGEPPLLLDDLMQGVGKYTEKNKMSLSVVLDEFQEITELPEAKSIEGILRSHIQFHRRISYFFVGSRRRILQDMFTMKNRPFYKSAFLYPLEKIAKEEFIPFIEKRFEVTGKTCPGATASSLYDLVEGYPYYVQKLASLLWDRTTDHATPEILAKAYETLIRTEAADFEAHWEGLTLVQRTLLKALALSPTAVPYSKDYLKRFGLSLGGTQKALRLLLARDLVEKGERGFRLTDPVMAGWLREETTDPV